MLVSSLVCLPNMNHQDPSRKNISLFDIFLSTGQGGAITLYLGLRCYFVLGGEVGGIGWFSQQNVAGGKALGTLKCYVVVTFIGLDSTACRRDKTGPRRAIGLDSIDG